MIGIIFGFTDHNNYNNQQNNKIKLKPTPIKSPKKHEKQTQQTAYWAKGVFYWETGTVGIIGFVTIKENMRVNNHFVTIGKI